MTDRAALRMTPQEVREFLLAQHLGVVAGHDQHGRLLSRRANSFRQDGEICLDLVPSERCFDLTTHAGLCFIVDKYPSHDEIQSVILHGTGVWLADAPARPQAWRSAGGQLRLLQGRPDAQPGAPGADPACLCPTISMTYS